jgi:hypothetical protein
MLSFNAPNYTKSYENQPFNRFLLVEKGDYLNNENKVISDYEQSQLEKLKQ